MRTYIKKIQEKPEHIRRRILVVTLVLSMVVVSSVWVYGLGYRFSEKKNEQVSVGNVKPFALFGNSLGVAYKNIMASVGNISSLGKTTETKVVTPNVDKQIDLIPVEYTN